MAAIDEVTAAKAIQIVQEALELDSPGRASKVQYLDGRRGYYYLVVLGDDEHSLAVAVVEASDGVVNTAARLPGENPHPQVGKTDAVSLSGLGEVNSVELVWKPCAASLSKLYPLWEVKNSTDTRYVDHAGNVHRKLTPAGPG